MTAWPGHKSDFNTRAALEPEGLCVCHPCLPTPALPVEASLQRHWVSPGVLPDTLPGPESSLLGLPLGLWGHSPVPGNMAIVEEQKWLTSSCETALLIFTQRWLFFLAGGRWGGGGVKVPANFSCFLTLPLPNWRGCVSRSWCTQQRNTQQSRELPLGWPPAPYSSHRAHSGSLDLKAYLGWLARAPATSCGRAIQTPVQTNQWPYLSHKGVMTAHLSGEASEAIKECGM